MSNDPADLVAALGGRGLTLATAESLTGGRVAASVTGVPGSSAVFLGGVVSYATRVKIDVLGVPEELVARHGVVSAECAVAMASGVRALLGADLGIGTTGVAGPDPQEGKSVGTVFVAVAGPDDSTVLRLTLTGSRASIQQQTVDAAIGAAVSAAYGMVSRRAEEPGLG